MMKGMMDFIGLGTLLDIPKKAYTDCVIESLLYSVQMQYKKYKCI